MSFSLDPWPRWQVRTALGVTVVVELFVPHLRPAVVLTFRLAEPALPFPVRLSFRPLFSGRDFHALQQSQKAHLRIKSHPSSMRLTDCFLTLQKNG